MKILTAFGFVVLNGIAYCQCDDFFMTIDFMNPTCYGFCDGSVVPNVTGGNGGNEYEITDTNGTIINIAGGTSNVLCDGWYYCHVEDDSGCVLYDSVYLENPDPVEPVMIYTQPTSLGSCDGVAEADTVLGYQGSYTGLSYFWSPGGPSGTGETIKTDLCDDFYTLTVNDEWGCSATIDFAMGSASIESQSLAAGLSLFPNPSADVLNIQAGFNIDHVMVYNLLGEQVKFQNDGNCNNQQLNLSDFSAGTYYLHIFGAEEVLTTSFVKN